MMLRKIMAPLGPEAKDLKSIQYALALAERLHAEVFILNANRPPRQEYTQKNGLEDALLDLVNSARQAGLGVSYHTARGFNKEEILQFVKEEGVDLLVFGEDGVELRRSLVRIKPRPAIRIVEVRDKAHTH